ADGSALPLWEVGYGYVNLDQAVKLVTAKNWRSALGAASAKADSRVLAADGYAVSRADLWQYPAPHATVAGTDTQTFSTSVASTVRYLGVTLSHPSLGSVALNG